jgi:hypothetical protein
LAIFGISILIKMINQLYIYIDKNKTKAIVSVHDDNNHNIILENINNTQINSEFLNQNKCDIDLFTKVNTI